MFDRVYVVHLPHPARRTAIDTELARMGLQATFLHAKPPGKIGLTNMRRNPAVEFGIALSHVKALVRALDDGAECPLFLEDDIQFRCDATRLREVFAELPERWSVLYLGGHPRGPVTRATKSLVKVSTFSFAEAYAINRKALRPFLDYWLDRIGQPQAMYDFVLGEFAGKHDGYCAYPLLTEQAPVPSHISGRIESRSNLLTNGWQAHLPA